MKKFFICAGIILLMGCAGVFAANIYMENLLAPENISKKCGQTLGVQLKLDEAPKWSIFPPRVSFANLACEYQFASTHYRLVIPAGEILLDLSPLLQGQIQISSISLDKPELIIKENASTSAKNETGSSALASNTGPDFSIKKLIAKNGKLSWESDGLSLNFANLNLSAENLHLHQEATIKCDFTITAPQLEDYPLFPANAAIKAKARYYAPNLTIRNGALTFTPAAQENSWPSINLTLNGALDTSNQNWKISGSSLAMASLRLAFGGEGNFAENHFSGNASLEYKQGGQENSVALVAETPVLWEKNILDFPDMAIKFGASAGQGKLQTRFPSKDGALAVNGDFNFGNIVIPQNIKADEPPENIASNPDNSAKSAFRTTGGKFAWPDINLAIKISSLSWQKFQLDDMNLKVAGQNGRYQTDDFTFKWADGAAKLLGALNLDANNSFELRLETDKTNMGQALAQLGFAGISNGEAKILAHLSGHGFRTEEILPSLNGNMQISGGDAAIKIFSEINSLLPLLHNSKYAMPQKVEKVFGKCAANKGILYCRPIQIESERMSCDASAQFDLLANNVHGNAVIKAFGANLPIVFNGPPDNVSWRAGPGFMDELRNIFN